MMAGDAGIEVGSFNSAYLCEDNQVGLNVFDGEKYIYIVNKNVMVTNQLNNCFNSNSIHLCYEHVNRITLFDMNIIVFVKSPFIMNTKKIHFFLSYTFAVLL